MNLLNEKLLNFFVSLIVKNNIIALIVAQKLNVEFLLFKGK